MKMVLFMDGKAGLCILSMKTGLFMDKVDWFDESVHENGVFYGQNYMVL